MEVPSSLDETVKQHFLKEAELNKQLKEINAIIKEKRGDKDRDIQDAQTRKKIDEIEEKIQKAINKKTELYDKITKIRFRDSEPQTVSENLSLATLRRGPLRDTKEKLEKEKSSLTKSIASLRERAEKLKLKLPRTGPGGVEPTLQQLNQQLAALDTKIAKGEKQNQMSLVDHLKKEKSVLEKTRPQLEEYWRLIDELFQQQTREKVVIEQLETKTEEFEKLEKTIKSLEEKKKQFGDKAQPISAKELKEKTDELREQINKIKDQIETLRNQKQSLKFVGSDPAMAKYIETRDGINQSLTEVRKLIPSKTIRYDKDFHSVLIGPQGATIQGLQEEFGVVLNVSQEQGLITAKGGQAELQLVEDAIHTLLKNAKDSRAEHKLKFDPHISRDLIGPQGSNIKKFQEKSGARIQIQDGTITIKGTSESVESAKQILEDFIENTHRIEISFKPDIVDVCVGRGGKVIKSIKEETGVKAININKEAGKIEIIGNKAAAEKAKEKYRDIISGFSSGGVTINLEQGIVGAIVGKGGANIRRIQDETGTLINISRPKGGSKAKEKQQSVNIKGPVSAVQEARRQIEQLMQDEQYSEKVNYDTNLRYFLIRPIPGDTDGLCHLEKIRRENNCARLEASRNENYITVTGKRDNVNEAVKQLRNLLLNNDRDAAKVSFPSILFRVITSKDEGSTLLEKVSQSAGCDSINADRNTLTITILGEKTKVQQAHSELTQKIDEMQKSIITVALPHEKLARVVIGTGGQTINRIRRETGCELDIDDKAKLISIYGNEEGRKKAEANLQKIFAENPITE